MKLTREEALKRVTELHHSGTAPSLHCKTQDLVYLMLSVQAETEQRVREECRAEFDSYVHNSVHATRVDCQEAERRVVEKCCDIAEKRSGSGMTIARSIRAAFPEEVPQ